MAALFVQSVPAFSQLKSSMFYICMSFKHLLMMLVNETEGRCYYGYSFPGNRDAEGDEAERCRRTGWTDGVTKYDGYRLDCVRSDVIGKMKLLPHSV